MKLPAMTDPLGRHWNQPANLRERIGVYFNHVTIDEYDWRRLSKYETTNPSGVYPGKAWRSGHWLCWYGPERNGFCRLARARALVQGPGVNLTYRNPSP